MPCLARVLLPAYIRVVVKNSVLDFAWQADSKLTIKALVDEPMSCGMAQVAMKEDQVCIRFDYLVYDVMTTCGGHFDFRVTLISEEVNDAQKHKGVKLNKSSTPFPPVLFRLGDALGQK